MKDELLQIFPTPILITKYEGSLVDELKYIDTLDWIDKNLEVLNDQFSEEINLENLKKDQ